MVDPHNWGDDPHDWDYNDPGDWDDSIGCEDADPGDGDDPE